jgi:UDP-glucose 4-epimerase
MSPYATSKYMTELMLEDYHKAYGLNYISTRYFNAAGADPEAQNGYTQEPASHVMPILIDCAMNGTKFTICGDDYDTKDGTCIRDYCHIQDIAKLKAVDYLNNGGESGIFNLGSGVGFSIFDLISSVENVTGKKVNYEVGPRRAGDPSYLCADTNKAKELLNWQPNYNLDQMFEHSQLWLENKSKAIKNK